MARNLDVERYSTVSGLPSIPLKALDASDEMSDATNTCPMLSGKIFRVS